MKQLLHKKRTGFIFMLAGLAIWLLPFAFVAADNAGSATRPADDLINNYGALIITVGPLLFLLGLVLVVLSAVKHLKP